MTVTESELFENTSRYCPSGLIATELAAGHRIILRIRGTRHSPHLHQAGASAAHRRARYRYVHGTAVWAKILPSKPGQPAATRLTLRPSNYPTSTPFTGGIVDQGCDLSGLWTSKVTSCGGNSNGHRRPGHNLSCRVGRFLRIGSRIVLRIDDLKVSRVGVADEGSILDADSRGGSAATAARHDDEDS